jgi:hypothetical protein
MTFPQLLWEWGTAYDLFASLEILHNPTDFGLRAVWAAGVCSRLPSQEREFLEQGQILFQVPLHWIHALPEPKDANTVLWNLEQILPAQRLSTLALSPDKPSDLAELLRDVAARRAWDEGAREALGAIYKRWYQHRGERKALPVEKLTCILDGWSRPDELGEGYLQAVRAYQESFFAEEERRIRPALQQALTQAQEMAGQLSLPDLLEELSQGLRFDELPTAGKMALVPSFWFTPLMYMGKVSADRWVCLF